MCSIQGVFLAVLITLWLPDTFTFAHVYDCLLKHKHVSENVGGKSVVDLYDWVLPVLAFAGPAVSAPVAPPPPATCNSESLKSLKYKRKG